MYKKLGQLGFVIGLFFVIVSIILSVNIAVKQLTDKLSLYTAIGFLVFGVGMIFLNKKD
jgi:hypothetical protein